MTQKRRILIVTDSLSMPGNDVRYEDTWIYLLKERFPGYDIIDRPARGSTSMRLVHEGGGGMELLELYMPDTVILQLGITECAPRLFNKRSFEYRFVNSILPGRIRKNYVSYIKKTRPRNPRYADVSPSNFRSNIFNFAERCRNIGTGLFIFKILQPTRLFISRSPHIQGNIDRWNSIYSEAAEIFENVTLLDPVNATINVESICHDELHINTEGHRLYFKEIEACFSK